MAKVVVKGEQGYNACTYKGHNVVTLIENEIKLEKLNTIEILAEAASTGDEKLLNLSLDITDSQPCPDCGYIKNKCVCLKLHNTVEGHWYN